ncbi:hypothetical protein AURANDRAFT_63684 [Aureococcus anophagefferens]|uniref:Uncharacterized protein n=1 Tax=Aureococcus anophagefferens TaxID=44056 RepID=F0Y6S4_AURAN|nr:hypothetical protein AURANDRAFT_63684 [Aureococcus anophagefferens]EGB09067.1 hypothetical protein AURANDRAFT_63684 [Aureococcus anophagefferens]|eukprot:XP_009036192.1 hypothetical protein AURANDRAFT_63684 [Aureococcus anophagefferens]
MCKPTGEPGCKATLEKACAACGEHKPEADYSKKQFAAKSAARRCKACVAAGKEAGDVSNELRAPAPLAKTLCWDLYYRLQGVTKAAQAGADSASKKDAYLRASEGLSAKEMMEHDFADGEAASMAVLRAMALLDTPGGGPDCRPASFLLAARGMLWLSRDAQKRKPLPPGEYAGLAMEGESLQATLRNYLDQLKKHAECAPLALASYAFACVRCVAVDDGHSARPAWAEAWLVRAECELFLGELQAAAKKGKSSGKRPAGRVGPWGDEAWLAGDAADRPWEPSVPGHPAQRGGLARLHLADHWWGLDETTAKPGGHRDGELVDRFRTVFAGSPFEPSDFFVRHLAREDQKESLWALAYVDDAKATLGVADCGNSKHGGKVLATFPASGDVFAGLRRAMAGAGDEPRALAGPPRRPRAVEFPADLEGLAGDLAPKLAEAFDVEARVAAAGAAPRAAFRALKRDRAPRAAAAPAFANGALVTVAGLVSKAAHNGRSGDVLRWLPDKGRYEVMLKPDGDLASTLISLKPANLVIAS